MIMFSIKNCNGILEGAAQVVKLFGDEPFTPDKYNAARGKGRSVAETLFNHNIIKVVGKAPVYVTYGPNPRRTTPYVTNRAGELLMKYEEYRELPMAAKEALITANGGEELGIHYDRNDITICYQDTYAFNASGYQKYLQEVSANLLSQIESKKQEVLKMEDCFDKVVKAFQANAMKL